MDVLGQNVSPSSDVGGAETAQALRRAVLSTFVPSSSGRSAHIVLFKAYLELSNMNNAPSNKVVQLRSEMQKSGITLTDTPHVGRKNTADFMITSDIMGFALDNPAPARIVLVSGDGDMACHLSKLHDRGYEIILIVPSFATSSPALRGAADVVLDFRPEVINKFTQNSLQKSPSASLEKSRCPPALKGATATSPHFPSGPGADSTSTTSTHSSSPTFMAQKAEFNPNGFSAMLLKYAPLIDVILTLPPEPTFSSDPQADTPSRKLRSKVSAGIQRDHGTSCYQRAGVKSWSKYAAEAEREGLIRLGRGAKPGLEWVELNENHGLVTACCALRSQKPGAALPTLQAALAAVRAANRPPMVVQVGKKNPISDSGIAARDGAAANAEPTLFSDQESITKEEKLGSNSFSPPQSTACPKAKEHKGHDKDEDSDLSQDLNQSQDYAHEHYEDGNPSPPSTPWALFQHKRPNTLGKKSLSSNTLPLDWHERPDELNGEPIGLDYKCLVWLLYEQYQREWSTSLSEWIRGSLRKRNGAPTHKLASSNAFETYLEEAAEAHMVLLLPYAGKESLVRLHPRFKLDYDQIDAARFSRKLFAIKPTAQTVKLHFTPWEVELMRRILPSFVLRKYGIVPSPHSESLVGSQLDSNCTSEPLSRHESSLLPLPEPLLEPELRPEPEPKPEPEVEPDLEYQMQSKLDLKSKSGQKPESKNELVLKTESQSKYSSAILPSEHSTAISSSSVQSQDQKKVGTTASCQLDPHVSVQAYMSRFSRRRIILRITITRGQHEKAADPSSSFSPSTSPKSLRGSTQTRVLTHFLTLPEPSPGASHGEPLDHRLGALVHMMAGEKDRSIALNELIRRHAIFDARQRSSSAWNLSSNSSAPAVIRSTSPLADEKARVASIQNGLELLGRALETNTIMATVHQVPDTSASEALGEDDHAALLIGQVQGNLLHIMLRLP